MITTEQKILKTRRQRTLLLVLGILIAMLISFHSELVNTFASSSQPATEQHSPVETLGGKMTTDQVRYHPVSKLLKVFAQNLPHLNDK